MTGSNYCSVINLMRWDRGKKKQEHDPILYIHVLCLCWVMHIWEKIFAIQLELF